MVFRPRLFIGRYRTLRRRREGRSLLGAGADQQHSQQKDETRNQRHLQTLLEAESEVDKQTQIGLPITVVGPVDHTEQAAHLEHVVPGITLAVAEHRHAAGAVITLAVGARTGLKLLAPRGFVTVLEHMVDVDRRHDAEVRLRVEVRHILGIGVVAGTDFQTGIDLHVRRAVNALASSQ